MAHQSDGASTGAYDVPDDILHVFCEKLADAVDFDTLFQCALTAKRFAIPALTNLYRSHNFSHVIGGGGEGDLVTAAQALLLVQKWSIMWRSIIASSLGTTVFPYCRYIKTLDFRDLNELLSEDKFRGNVFDKFFANEMSRFKITVEAPKAKGGAPKRRPRLDIPAVIDAIGEVITQYTPTLEQISGPIKPGALIKWAPRLPRLASLQLWEGTALADPQVQENIIAHCPKFDALSFYIWNGEAVDQQLASFLIGLQSQRLRFFESISSADIGEASLLSLNAHGESLKTLKIALKSSALPYLGHLKNCTALETLELEDLDVSTRPTDLEATQHDVFLEVGEWLRNCKSLRTLSFTGFLSAARLVTPILLQNDTKLRHLKVDWYTAHSNPEFHRALAHQPGLEWLHLASDSEGMTRDDIDTLIDNLVQLKELKYIKLVGVSDFFNDEHIIKLAQNLPNLDEIYFTGLQVSDVSLPALANLKYLRRLDVASISTFTVEGLIDFVDRLGPGNRGFEFMVGLADPGNALSDEEVSFINSQFAEKVDGRLDYTLFRDPNVSDIEESDSE